MNSKTFILGLVYVSGYLISTMSGFVAGTTTYITAAGAMPADNFYVISASLLISMMVLAFGIWLTNALTTYLDSYD